MHIMAINIDIENKKVIQDGRVFPIVSMFNGRGEKTTDPKAAATIVYGNALLGFSTFDLREGREGLIGVGKGKGKFLPATKAAMQ